MAVSSTSALAAFQSILTEIIAEATETIDVTRQKASRGEWRAILKLELLEAQHPQEQPDIPTTNDKLLDMLA